MRKETKNGATFPVPCWFTWQGRKFHELDGEQLSPFGNDRLDQPIGGHEDQQNESDDAQCHLDPKVYAITYDLLARRKLQQLAGDERCCHHGSVLGCDGRNNQTRQSQHDNAIPSDAHFG